MRCDNMLMSVVIYHLNARELYVRTLRGLFGKIRTLVRVTVHILEDMFCFYFALFLCGRRQRRG